uniref:Uncharacterized protein n=1 Tax=Romanomermis culicivorax TaxID=13658 RepID=A0A915ITJ7_ROMCU
MSKQLFSNYPCSVQEVRAEENSDSSHSHSLCKSDEENEDIDEVVICENVLPVWQQFKVGKYANAWVAANYLRADNTYRVAMDTGHEKKNNFMLVSEETLKNVFEEISY